MTMRVQERDAKLEEQCAVVAALIVAMRPIYRAASPRQRALLETIIGAGIWYIPKPLHAWTGRISVAALRAFHPESGVLKPRLSEEHVYPRKVAARLLLEDASLDGPGLAHLFREKYGRVHLITSEENKAVQPFQRVSIFTSPDEAYEKAGVTFIDLPEEELRQVKRRHRETIDRHLNGYTQNAQRRNKDT